jgi:phenylpropionate dioxygenase-like ring-hydroxylating dioxygenase large terminal subunit
MPNDAIPTFLDARNKRQKVRAAGMHPDHWFPAEYDDRVAKGEVVEVKFWGKSIALFRDTTGELHAIENRCAHRQIKLSKGEIRGCHVVCPYHGWTYDGTGGCTLIPAVGTDGRVPGRAQLEMLPVPAPGQLTIARPVDDDEVDEEHDCPTLGFIDGDTPGLAGFWHPVARLGELPPTGEEGLDVELLGETWRVEQDADGWSATSPFGMPAWGVVPHLDHLWLAPCRPVAPLPEVVEWGREGWHHRRIPRAEGRLGVGLLLDNQLDAGHFPFVHTETFGSPAGESVPPPEMTRSGTTIKASMRVAIAARNDPSAQAGERDLQQHRTMHYEFHAPLWLRLQLDYEDMGGTTLILFSLTPLAAGRARMDVDLLFRHPDGFTDAQLDDRVAFEERVIGEDLRLQRLFEDLRLPLDPAAEVHTKADRLSLQVRQLLRELLSTGDPGTLA